MAPKAAPKPTASAPTREINTGAAAAVKTLVIFSILMVTVPSALYLSVVHGFFDVLFGATIGVPSPESRPIAGAISAVVGVNFVVACFVYIAFQDINDDGPKEKAE